MTTYYYEDSTSTKFGRLLGKGARGLKNGFIKFSKLTKNSYNYLKKLNKPGEHYFDDYQNDKTDLLDEETPIIDTAEINSQIYWDYEKNTTKLPITKYKAEEEEEEEESSSEEEIEGQEEEESNESIPSEPIETRISPNEPKKKSKPMKMLTYDFLDANKNENGTNNLAVAKWQPKEDNFDVFNYILDEDNTPSVTLTENNHSSSDFDVMDFVTSEEYNKQQKNGQWTQF